MKNLFLKILSVILFSGVLSAVAYAGEPIQNEYLKAAGRLRTWAAQETDPAKREEYLNQADEYEHLAELDAPVEPDSILPDGSEDTIKGRAANAKRRQQQMQRDFQRWRTAKGLQDDPNCVACSDAGYDDNVIIDDTGAGANADPDL